MIGRPGQHVIAHHFGPQVTRQLLQRWPDIPVLEVDAKQGWHLPGRNLGAAVRACQSLGQCSASPARWVAEGLAMGTDSGSRRRHLPEVAVPASHRLRQAAALIQCRSPSSRWPAFWHMRSDCPRSGSRAMQIGVPIEARPVETRPDTVEGKVLGLIGFGSIGREIACRALAFGMRVVVLRRSDAPVDACNLSEQHALTDLLAQADHVVLALPYTPETHHIIDGVALSKTKPGAHLVNVARGALVDQDALIEAFDRGQIAAATLDVAEPGAAAGRPSTLQPHARAALAARCVEQPRHTRSSGPQVQRKLRATTRSSSAYRCCQRGSFMKFVLFQTGDTAPVLPGLLTDRGVVDISGAVRAELYAAACYGRHHRRFRQHCVPRLKN